MKKKDLQLWDYVRTVLLNTAADLGLPRPDIRPIKKKWCGKYVGSCSKRHVLRIACEIATGSASSPTSL